MGDDIGSGSFCFDFRHSAAQCSWVCHLWSPNDHRQQPVTEPEPMSKMKKTFFMKWDPIAEVFYGANYCCFRDKKCMKMSSLFTLLRFFDELFDVITFWRCKKTSAHEIWGVSLIQYKFRMVLNPLYWTEGNISWSKSNISRMKQCTSYSWKLFWAVWEFRFMSMYFCIKSVILKSFGMYILKYFTKMILPIQFL